MIFHYEIIFCIFKHSLCLREKKPVITLLEILPFMSTVVSTAKMLLKHEEAYDIDPLIHLM